MIQALRPVETVFLDMNRVEEVIARLGPLAADEVISRTMEELAVQLAKVHKCVALGLTDDIRNAATKIAEFSAHIGMASLSRVALDVAYVAATGGGAALAATAARLDRVGEASLMQVWDLQDLSM